MSAELESARRDWEDGYRRFEQAADADPAQAERLGAMLDVLVAELRRRVGSTFDLGELGRVYDDAEAWGRCAIEEQAAVAGWPAGLTVATDAAFHLVARGAIDYTP